MTSSVLNARFIHHMFFVPDAPQRSDYRCDDATFDVTPWPRVPERFNRGCAKFNDMTGSSVPSRLNINFRLLIITNTDLIDSER